MIEETTARRSARLTRQCILEAAILRFSEHSYEATTLRDIAADVGVDVALVHRSFGSKEELFQQAVRGVINGDFQQVLNAPDPGAAMTAHFIRSRFQCPAQGTDPIDILAHSLGSDRAGPILRELVQRDFVQPLALRRGGGELGSAVAIACVAGVALLRDVLGLAVLREAEQEEMSAIIAKLMHACLGPPEERALPEAGERAGHCPPRDGTELP